MSEELERRLAALEAQVAWLLEQERSRLGGAALPRVDPAPTPVASPPPLPARPSRPVAPPRKPVSPAVWVAGAGAGIFLIGVIFFLVWSIQRGWLGPEMRLLLGLTAGVALTALAARLILGSGRQIGVAVLLAGLGTLQFSFRAGAFSYHFFPPALGLAGAALATFLAGALAARARSGAALGVALVSGLVAPLVFSEGGHHEVALAVYLLVVMAAVLAVPYVSGEGAGWNVARWLAVVGTWVLLAGSIAEVRQDDAATLLLVLFAHLALSGLWIWLPGRQEKPGTPTLLWILVSLAATTLGGALWQRLEWTPELYSVPVVALAALNLALVKPLRVRLGSRQADLGLLALAVGLLACAVPIALDWRWVGPLWGLLAVALAWASGRSEENARAEEASALRVLAFGLAVIASVRWVVHGVAFWFDTGSTPFFNVVFAEGALAAASWLLLARRGGDRAGEGRGFAFVACELVGNLTLAFECAHLVRWIQSDEASVARSHRGSGITITLVLALSGALQWLVGVRREAAEERRAPLVAGYCWLGFAGVKLIVADLDGADTPLRALAFLGVGAIFLVAALLAHRLRPEQG